MPGLILPESNTPVGTDVTVCATVSLLVHVTVVPIGIVTVSGLNAEFLISTATDIGVVVCIDVVVGVSVAFDATVVFDVVVSTGVTTSVVPTGATVSVT